MWAQAGSDWSDRYNCSLQYEDLLLGRLDLADLVCKHCFQVFQTVAQIDTIRGVRLHDSMVRLSLLFSPAAHVG